MTVTLTPGDLVVFTSDGVIEAMTATNELFGFERLEQLVASGPTISTQAMLQHVQTGITGFIGVTEPHDDLTIMILKMRDTVKKEELMFPKRPI